MEIDTTWEQPDHLQIERKVWYSPSYVATRLVRELRRSGIIERNNRYIGRNDWLEERLEEFVKKPFTITIESEVAWTVGCSLGIRVDHSWSPERVIFPGHQVFPVSFSFNLNWSSTHRTIAQAQANVALYQEFINVAASLQSIVDEHNNIAQINKYVEEEISV